MTKTVWYKVTASRDELPEGWAKSVTCGVETICLAHFDGQLAALDNRCPHQEGPLDDALI
jgi:pyruvate oxidase